MFDSSETSIDRDSATRQRLLEAAGEVFSERGFREATVREISSRAGVNIAAVNYHFGDKNGLYRAVLTYANRCAGPMVELGESGGAGGEGAREEVRGFVRAYLEAMVQSGKPAWHARLIAREMLEPSPALDAIVNENIRPRSERLGRLVEELLGAAATPERVVRCKFSVIGQCLIYFSGRHVLERLHPERALTRENLGEVANHIAEFSLAAMECLRSEAEKARSGGGAR